MTDDERGRPAAAPSEPETIMHPAYDLQNREPLPTTPAGWAARRAEQNSAWRAAGRYDDRLGYPPHWWADTYRERKQLAALQRRGRRHA